MVARVIVVMLILAAGTALPWAGDMALAQSKKPPQLRTYEGKYYVIHTDLAGDDLREADLRMSKMAEEYRNRTKDFSGAIGHKFPFFLFSNPADYYAAGGQPGSAGVFDPNSDTLMAMADERTGDYTWNVVQHEGFHQFARSVIGGQLPIWVNEGLAEYFGEGLFTGDGFITGVIPPKRLVRIKQQMKGKQFRPIKEMMLLAHADWNQELSLANYDQAWSMVQFLAHADDGKYQKAFVGFMRMIATGRQWDQAWVASFGSAEGFEDKWRKYWLSLPDDPTSHLFAKATTMTLTGVLARATAEKQKFATFADFSAAAKNHTAKFDQQEWLPPALIDSAVARSEKMQADDARFELVPASGGRGAMIVCTLKDGTKLLGKFTLKSGRLGDVVVEMPNRK